MAINRRASLLSLLEYPDSFDWKPNRNLIFREGDFVQSVVAPGVMGIVKKVDDGIHKVYVQWNGGKEYIQMEPEYLSLVPMVDPVLRERFAPAKGPEDEGIQETVDGIMEKIKGTKVNDGFMGHTMKADPEGGYEAFKPGKDYLKPGKYPTGVKDHAYEHAHLDLLENGPKDIPELKDYHDKLVRNETGWKPIKNIPELIEQRVVDNLKGTGLETPKCDKDHGFKGGEVDFSGTPEQQRVNDYIEHGMVGKPYKASPKIAASSKDNVDEKAVMPLHPLVPLCGRFDEPRYSMENEMIIRQVHDDIADVLSFAKGVTPKEIPYPSQLKETHVNKKLNGEMPDSDVRDAIQKSIRELKKKLS